MEKTNKILAGYRITAVSCENDGDHYRTIVKEGLDEKQITLLGEVIKIMYSGDSRLENNYEPGKDEIDFGHKVYLKVFEKYSDMFTSEQMKAIRKSFRPIDDYICEYLTGRSVEGYALRCLQEATIEYFPQEVIIEDVTEKFVK